MYNYLELNSDNCSNHGSFNSFTGKCTCKKGWTSDDCSVAEKKSVNLILLIIGIFIAVILFSVIYCYFKSKRFHNIQRKNFMVKGLSGPTFLDRISKCFSTSWNK
jgi:hypothetical protein